MGLVLQELGVNLAGYLASASILAYGLLSSGSKGWCMWAYRPAPHFFGHDGRDMVEIAGTTVVVGRVEELGLRFTTVFLQSDRLYSPTAPSPMSAGFRTAGVCVCAYSGSGGAERTRPSSCERGPGWWYRRDHSERAGHGHGGNGGGRRVSFRARPLQNLAGQGSRHALSADGQSHESLRCEFTRLAGAGNLSRHDGGTKNRKTASVS